MVSRAEVQERPSDDLCFYRLSSASKTRSATLAKWAWAHRRYLAHRPNPTTCSDPSSNYTTFIPRRSQPMVPYIPQEVGMKQEGTSSDCRPLHLLFGPAIALSPPPSSHSRAHRLVPRQTQSVLSVGIAESIKYDWLCSPCDITVLQTRSRGVSGRRKQQITRMGRIQFGTVRLYFFEGKFCVK